MGEDGDTASWLVEIFADGPKSEEEVATRLEVSGAEESPAVHLEATPFTRECAELWVATHRRRFRIYSIGAKKPGPKPKEKAPPRQGTMKRVAYDCKLARDALASRVGAARSDITLAGDSRKTLQVRNVGSAGGGDGLQYICAQGGVLYHADLATHVKELFSDHIVGGDDDEDTCDLSDEDGAGAEHA